MRGQLGNSNRYDIHFTSRKLIGNSTNPPSIFFLNFNGESYYNKIKNKIENPQSTSKIEIDGKAYQKLIIPVENNK